MTCLRALIVSLVLLSSAVVAAEDIELSVMNKVLHGRDKPSITLGINKAIRSGELVLEVPNKPAFLFKLAATSDGGRLTFPLDLDPGSYQISGKLNVDFEDGASGEMPLQFMILVALPMSIEAPPDLQQINARKAVVRVSRLAQYCDYRVEHEGGAQVSGRAVFGAAEPGADLEISWPRLDSESQPVVLRVVIECFDVDYFSNGIEILPWSAYIPHEEVNFESGSSVLLSSEVPKIEAVIGEIHATVNRYKDAFPIAMYITGHTDTVGASQDNLKLSVERARAVAKYFSEKNLSVPIYYGGLGETELAVKTPDETPEIRNRRLDYQLNCQAPAKVIWKRLRTAN